MRAYTYNELGQLKPTIIKICEQVKHDNPVAWSHAHDGSFSDESRRFNDLCVQALRRAGIDAGMNGKRGDANSRSDDVLDFGLHAGQGGAQDKGGTFAEIAIIDFIAGAGGPNPSIGWIDVSSSAPGIYLEPQGLPADSGSGGGTQPPVQPPVQPPPGGGSSSRPGLPPDAELAEVQETFNGYYRDKLGRPAHHWHVDPIGIGRWSWDYQDLRAQGYSHAAALDEVMARIVALTGVPR